MSDFKTKKKELAELVSVFTDNELSHENNKTILNEIKCKCDELARLSCLKSVVNSIAFGEIVHEELNKTFSMTTPTHANNDWTSWTPITNVNIGLHDGNIEIPKAVFQWAVEIPEEQAEDQPEESKSLEEKIKEVSKMYTDPRITNEALARLVKIQQNNDKFNELVNKQLNDTYFTVGKAVFDIRFGWGVVTKVNQKENSIFPIHAMFSEGKCDSYTFAGRASENHNPILSLFDYFNNTNPISVEIVYEKLTDRILEGAMPLVVGEHIIIENWENKDDSAN